MTLLAKTGAITWLTGLFRSSPAATEPWSRVYDPAATPDDIFFCFRLLLGRSPNREEWRGHAAQAGAALPSVVGSYLNSLEFSRRNLLTQDRLAGVELAALPLFSIYAAMDDLAVGRHVRADNYEPDVTQVFRRVLRPGMGVLDIGANIGYFSMLSAALVGAAGYVLAVEPNPANIRLLEASRRANGFGQMTVSQTAAGPQAGLLVLHSSHSNGTTSALPDDLDAMLGAEIVSCVPPDALVPATRRIDLIKVDVEGAEYKALQGCTDIIARDRPVIVSEFSPDLMEGISGIDGPGYLAWLAGHGYGLAVIAPDGAFIAVSSGHEQVMDIYRARGTDHIDIVATPLGHGPP
jgi:FkbM family methyltransferase